MKPPVVAEPPTCLITANSVKDERIVRVKSTKGFPLRITSVQVSEPWIQAVIGSGPTSGPTDASATVPVRIKAPPPVNGKIANAEIKLHGENNQQPWTLTVPAIYVHP